MQKHNQLLTQFLLLPKFGYILFNLYLRFFKIKRLYFGPFVNKDCIYPHPQGDKTLEWGRWKWGIFFLLFFFFFGTFIILFYFFSFHTWYFTCFNAILPNLPTLSLSHSVHKTVLYISVSFLTILRHCCLNGNQVKIEILNSVRGNCCLSLLSLTHKL